MYNDKDYTIDDLFKNGDQSLGRPVLPNTPDFQNTYQNGVALSNIRDNRIIFLSPGGRIQAAIDTLSKAGGGELRLLSGTFKVTNNIILPNGVSIIGSQVGTIIDFDNTASQILAEGTDPYNTGTVTINNDDTTVTGSGTTWTAAMVGQSILIEEFWYVISGFTSATSIDIESPYSGEDLVGATYTIATPIEALYISGLTIQNSTAALIKAQFVNGITIDGCYLYNGLVGFDGDDGSGMNFLNTFVDTCGTGLLLNNFHFSTYFNFNIINSTSGGAFIADGMKNTAIEVFGFQNNVGDALSLTNAENTGVEDFSIKETTGVGIKFTNTTTVTCLNGTIEVSSSDGAQFTSSSKCDFSGITILNSGGQGIELVSGNNDMQFTNMTVDGSGSDGYKLTATSDRISISNNSIINNGGYGINIAASTCDNNVIGLNSYSNNTSGVVNDSGTGTIWGGSSVEFFTANGTWTKKPGLKYVDVEGWGAGGGGASVASNQEGGGGGGGSYNIKRIQASELGATEAVTIGQGGAGGALGSNPGGAGNNTTFGSLVTFYGGGGGGNGNAGEAGGGGGGGVTGAGGTSGAGVSGGGGGGVAGGNGGTTGTAAGNSTFGGGGGGAGVLTFTNGGSSYYGGGGGGGCVSASGGNGGTSYYGGGGGGGASDTSAGSGGASTFGGSGGAGGSNTNGTAGTIPGGGGGASEQGVGGNGARGQLRVTSYF